MTMTMNRLAIPVSRADGQDCRKADLEHLGKSDRRDLQPECLATLIRGIVSKCLQSRFAQTRDASLRRSYRENQFPSNQNSRTLVECTKQLTVRRIGNNLDRTSGTYLRFIVFVVLCGVIYRRVPFFSDLFHFLVRPLNEY